MNSYTGHFPRRFAFSVGVYYNSGICTYIVEKGKPWIWFCVRKDQLMFMDDLKIFGENKREESGGIELPSVEVIKEYQELSFLRH